MWGNRNPPKFMASTRTIADVEVEEEKIALYIYLEQTQE